MKKKMIVLGSLSYGTPLSDKYDFVNTNYLPEIPHKSTPPPDLIVFTGGEDICPNMYGEENIRGVSGCNRARDRWEHAWWQYAVENKVPMVGICRGMQMFTVMLGGKLMQHIEGHAVAGSHKIITKDNKEVLVNSLHHQVCIPYNFEKKKYIGALLAWSHAGKNWLASPEVEERFVDMGCVPEAIWYPEVRALGVQFHPEMMQPNTAGVGYFKSIFDKYIG